MLAKMLYSPEFVVALEQSGGGTSSALTQFGTQQKQSHLHRGYSHTMRARIISSTAFYFQRLLAASLFKDVLNSNSEGIPSVD
jgi:fructose-bisphosphate aldolase class I